MTPPYPFNYIHHETAQNCHGGLLGRLWCIHAVFPKLPSMAILGCQETDMIDIDIECGKLVARLSRLNDPISSHSAAEKLVESGHYGKQCTGVLLALVDNPGTTSMELSIAANLDRHLVARRLPDLEKGGVVARGTMRRCKVGNRLATTWTATL